jgi:copper ion binding protein
MNTTTWTVQGMTCQHCVNAVTAEVSALDGVTAVDVDLENGQITVSSDTEIEVADLASAIDEAGYTLVSN